MKPIIFCVCACFFNFSLAQVNPHGQPFIKNHTIKDYHAASQNWAIARDARGVMYFANNDGVLQYDGLIWELIKINKGAIVRSLAIDSKGAIFVGAENEFGLIKPNKAGTLCYTSLSDSLSVDNQGFSIIDRVYVTSSSTLFCSHKKIFRYSNGTIQTINLPKGGFISHFVSNNLYIGDYWEGLMVLRQDSFVVCNGGAYYAEKDIFNIMPYKNDLLLVATSNTGLFIYNPKTGLSERPKFSAYQTLHNFIVNKNLYSIYGYSDGYRINTLYGGTVITDSTFKIKEIYNKTGGLQDEVILSDFLANVKLATEPLWLSLNNGISKVEANSPFRIFDERSGLPEEVLNTTQFNGKLYFATINGVYTLENNAPLPYFKKLQQTEGECWSMAECNGNLVIGGGYSFFVHNGNSTKRFETDDMVYIISPSKKHSNRFYVGENKGLSIFNFEKGQIHRVSKLSRITERVSNIIEDDNGDLWVTTIKNELFNVSISNKKPIITLYNDSLGLPQSQTLYPYSYENRIYFATSNRILTYNEKTGRIVPAKNLDSTLIKASVGLNHYAEDSSGNIWLVSSQGGANQICLLKKQGTEKFTAVNTPFKRLPPCIINTIYPDNNGITWIGTSEGLFTFNTQTQVSYNEPFNTLIRKVYVGEDSVLFHGAFFKNGVILKNQPKDSIPVLRYKNNWLTFHYSSPFFIEENETQYSYYLEGFDSESTSWSNWTKATKKEFTNLREGSYTFKVKAINIYGYESSVAEFTFQILPPWHRTFTAYIIYIILLSVFIWFIVKLNIRRLQLEKVKLEGIVAERTAEIRQQKDEIEKQKEEITDSIKYAKRIQTAILPPAEIITAHLPEHFILFKPRDIVSGDFYWMKQLGDYTLIAAADCTGHGVPGAFMSMLGIAFLNEIASHRDKFAANEILNELRNQVKLSLRQTGKEGEAKDGMDIAFCVINKKHMKLHYAGAYNPLYLYRNKVLPAPSDDICAIEFETHNLFEIKADKMPIGIHISEKDGFTNHELDIKPGDTIYIFSDGFVDQTGGESSKKFLSKNFKNLLFSIQGLEMSNQKEVLNDTIENWKGTSSQIDDILVIGIRFNI